MAICNKPGHGDNESFMSELEQRCIQAETALAEEQHLLQTLIDALYSTGKKVIFTMGKGGVGKTTAAVSIATGLANKGIKVHLTSTDPAGHLQDIVKVSLNLTLSHIDEKKELQNYQEEVFLKHYF